MSAPSGSSLAGPITLLGVFAVLPFVWPAGAPHLVLTICELLLGSATLVIARRRRRPVARGPAAGEPGPRGPGQDDVRPLVGRDPEIDRIIAQHAVIRRGHSELTMPGPVVILLHGMPGVGKSALAALVARRLRPGERPVVINLNSTGKPLATAHVLALLLRAMGWPDVPVPIEDRIAAFRTVTAQLKPLIILNSISDAAQLGGLMPNSSESTLILTSRSNFGPQHGIWSHQVRPLLPSDGLDLLQAVTRTGRYESVDCGSHLVEMCGGLPAAIRAVGERIVYEDKSVCGMLGTLRPASTRFRELTRTSPMAIDGIRAEYARLSPREQRALRLLTLLRSPTFGSWVLSALLEVTAAIGDMVATELANVCLLENAGRDPWLGHTRYRIHPVVRLFAENRLNADVSLLGECHDAAVRLHDAYRRLIRQLVTGRPTTGSGWSPSPPSSARPGALDRWLTAEMLNLSDVAETAFVDEPDLGWRTCALFGELIPQLPRNPPADWSRQPLSAARHAVEAAAAAGETGGALDARLSEVTLLLTVGRFTDAENLVADILRTAGHDHPDRALRAHLRLAEAYLESAWSERADGHLRRAGELLPVAGDPALAVRHQTLKHLSRPSGPPPVTAGDPDRYWTALGEVARLRASENLPAATRLLEAVCDQHEGNVRRRAVLHFWLAEAYFDQRHADTGFVLRASRHAVQAALDAEQLDHPLWTARGRLLLASTLHAAGHDAQASEHMRHADEAYDLRAGDAPPRAAAQRRELEAELHADQDRRGRQ